MKNKTRKAFTLVELVVATFISAIVLSFILIFLGDTMDNIAEGKSNTKILINFSEFQNKLNSYKDIYGTGNILINNDSSTGSDIFIMKNIISTDGIIISRINLDTKKIIEENNIYKESPIGVRRLSKQELIDIENDSSVIYNYIFQDDMIYYDLILKDFQVDSYNSGTITEFNLLVNPYYKDDFKGASWDTLKVDELLKLNIDF